MVIPPPSISAIEQVDDDGVSFGVKNVGVGEDIALATILAQGGASE